MGKILKNSVQCKFCGEVIESRHVHDYVTCECGKVSVDGGRDYLKRSYPANVRPEDAYLELSEQK
jgi:hypothetical protein